MVYAASKLFPYLMDGLTSKNSKSRAGMFFSQLGNLPSYLTFGVNELLEYDMNQSNTRIFLLKIYTFYFAEKWLRFLWKVE